MPLLLAVGAYTGGLAEGMIARVHDSAFGSGPLADRNARGSASGLYGVTSPAWAIHAHFGARPLGSRQAIMPTASFAPLPPASVRCKSTSGRQRKIHRQ